MDKLIIGIGGAGTNIVEFVRDTFDDEQSLLLITSDKNKFKKRKLKNRIFVGNKDKSKLLNEDAILCNLQQSLPMIESKIKNVDNLILVSGFGGITGKKVTFELLDLALKFKVKTKVIVVIPYKFESDRRKLALQSLELMPDESEYFELIVFDNEMLLNTGKTLSLNDAFNLASIQISKQIRDVFFAG